MSAKALEKLGYQEAKSHRGLDLKGHYVHPEAYHWLNGANGLDKAWYGLYEINRVMNAWKFGKTILNPATHMRNTMSNTMFATMSGMVPWSPSFKSIDIKKTIKEYWTRDGDAGLGSLDEASQGKLFGKTF